MVVLDHFLYDRARVVKRVTKARGHRPLAVRPFRATRERVRLPQVREPGAPAAMQHDPLRARTLTLDQLLRRGTSRAQRRKRAGQFLLGFRSDREPCETGAERTHASMITCD